MPTSEIRRIVIALGVTQIIGYGTLYYSFAILAQAVADSFAVASATLYAVFSAGFLLSGFSAPWLGRQMDQRGAPKLMALGSMLSALGLGVLAAAPNLAVYAMAFCLLEVVGVLVLYSAAFSCLAQFDGLNARRSITHLTLIAGFASTIFWPLTGWMAEAIGWRATYAAFAAMHLAIALPLHLWLIRRSGGVAGGHGKSDATRLPLSDRERLIAFWCVATSFALSGALMSALNVHLVPVLQAMGLGAAAYYTSMLMGPAQVAVRLSDALFWRGLHPTTVALISVSALCLSVTLLLSGLPAQIAGASFALVFGAGQGLSTIVSGTLPLALFGAAGFGARLGRLSAIRTLLSGFAPFVFAMALGAIGTALSLTMALAVGLAALAPLLYLRAFLLRRAQAPAGR